MRRSNALLVALFAGFFAVGVIGKITVHLVPHTHDDIGWLKTVDEYQYGLNLTIQPADVNELISSMVGQLLEDPARRFVYVEIGFFSRWFDRQDKAVQDNVRLLVGEQRLQFANGGWCMHDEAATHFVDMIDQTALGHRYLQRTVNAVPRVGWQVDPFGHSATQAALLSARAGFLGTYHARIDYQDYQQRIAVKNREFWWRPSPSMPDATVFGGVLLDTTYCAPGDFNWDITAVVPELIANTNTHIVNNNKNSPQDNVNQTLENFVSLATQRAAITLGDHQMWTMGCDFNYLAGALWFDNMDRLIQLVNDDGRIEAKYSTPYDYTVAKLKENVTYSEMLGDFFPYADGPHQFWTGYFTSRAALKRYIRQLSSYWTAARQLEAFGGVASGEVPPISDALGIAQHHDAVAGTAKQHVAFDYAKRLHEGYVDDMTRIRSSVSSLFGAATASTTSHCPLANVSVCAATATLSPTTNVSVLVWNPDAHTLNSMVVEIPVPSPYAAAAGPNVKRYDTYAASVGVTNYETSNALAQTHTIAVQLENVPAAGYVTFELYIYQGETSRAHPRTVASDANGTFVLRTSGLAVTFSTTQGITAITNVGDGTTVNVTQDWCVFDSNTGDALSSQPGGAYIFRPVTNGTCQSILPNGVVPTPQVITQSDNFFVVEQTIGYVTQRFIGHDDVVDLEFTVLGISVEDGWGKELIARFQTSIHNTNQNGLTVAYTDSNGREMMQRVQNTRVDFDLAQTEPVAGNYYPVDALMFVNDSVAQFNIFNDAGMGGGSINEGQMYLTVHRRLLHDDYRGVSEPLNETEFITSYATCNIADAVLCGLHYGPPLIVRGRLTLFVAGTSGGAQPMRRVRQLQDYKYFAPLVLFSATPFRGAPSSVLQADLPEPLQLVTLQHILSDTAILRIGHRYAVYEDALYSAPVTLSLGSILSLTGGWSIASFDEYSLMTTELLTENAVSVTIGPMDVKTFIVHLTPPA